MAFAISLGAGLESCYDWEMSSEVQKSEVAKREEAVLAFWKENRIFEKSLEKASPQGEFVFYEGPPTANGKPGIHHLGGRVFKDIIPRYKTMRGYHVRRKAGWDTHGLPVELEVEKEIGSKSKKDIEAYGIAKFNQKCKENVMRYIGEWKEFTDRIGFWVDHKDTYFTYTNDYIESVWSVLKRVSEQNLLYKDYKVVPWCPRCGTALSSHEVAQGYDEAKDPSVYVKFKLVGANEYFLAWTTTPWTLPGNVALAVSPTVTYVKVVHEGTSMWIAKDRLDAVLPGGNITEEKKGGELVGRSYEPLFQYLKDSAPEHQKDAFGKAYQVHTADFVSTEDGTGIVHTAVMYGADDFELGTKIGLPKHHLVNEDGKFSEDAGKFAGIFVKSADKLVIADLNERGLLFKEEMASHTYPFCWRCKTPLLYYARDSWYIRMSALKDKLISENHNIHWEPEHIRDGRFGEWLKDLKDWAISRSRYWGTPLPIWEAKDGSRIVIGSKEELMAHTKKSGNRYFVMRHGEVESNVKGYMTSSMIAKNDLTEKGKSDAQESAEKLKTLGIDLVIASPLPRTQQTAHIVAETIGLSKERVLTDERIREINEGIFEGKPLSEWYAFFSKDTSFDLKIPEGESHRDVWKRVSSLAYDIENTYSEKNILLITHDSPGWMLDGVMQGKTPLELMREVNDTFLQPGTFKETTFSPLPHDENFEIDYHRPYIDQVVLVKGGKEYRRVSEVLDVWFDSGAMPFAQDHYPFDKTHIDLHPGWFKKARGYPADYICEAIDQTRGWFYTLHAVGALMSAGRAFKNVISLGHILDAKGKKMSKSVGNVVEPWSVIEQYGVDALRYFMFTVNAPGDSKNFDVRLVDEIVKKHIGRLGNVLSFYKLYDSGTGRSSASSNVLDRWILARLNELVLLVTVGLENYQVDQATRPIGAFIDDLSVWYLRRSRDRFKEDGEDKAVALATLRFVLYTLAHTMAPSMPFFSEHLFRAVREEKDPESVHLGEWPGASTPEPEVLAGMEEVRRMVSLALEAREKAGIKVRQPLAKLSIPQVVYEQLPEADVFAAIIADEVNVKEITPSPLPPNEVTLDTILTPELKEEGIVRETKRALQGARRTARLQPSDIAKSATLLVTLQKDVEVLEKYRTELEKIARVQKLSISVGELMGATIDV